MVSQTVVEPENLHLPVTPASAREERGEEKKTGEGSNTQTSWIRKIEMQRKLEDATWRGEGKLLETQERKGSEKEVEKMTRCLLSMERVNTKIQRGKDHT